MGISKRNLPTVDDIKDLVKGHPRNLFFGPEKWGMLLQSLFQFIGAQQSFTKIKNLLSEVGAKNQPVCTYTHAKAWQKKPPGKRWCAEIDARSDVMKREGTDMILTDN